MLSVKQSWGALTSFLNGCEDNKDASSKSYSRNTKYTTIIACTTGAVFGCFLFHKIYDILDRKWHNYPPGPCGIPLFGSFFSLAYDKKYLIKINRRYGEITMCYNGIYPTLILSNFQIMKHYFNNQLFGNRLSCGMFKNDNLTWISGNDSKLRRGIIIKTLVSQIQSDKFLNILLSTVHNDIVTKLENRCSGSNNVWDVRNEVFFITFIAIYNSVIGNSKICKQFDSNIIDNPNSIDFIHFEQFRESMVRFFASANKAFIIAHFLPEKSNFINNLLRTVFVENTNCVLYQNVVKSILNKWLFGSVSLNDIAINRDDTDDNDDNYDNDDIDNQSCLGQLIQLYKNGVINKDELLGDLSVCFNAGMHTTSIALEQAILFLAKYSNMQQEVYDQLVMNLKNNNINIDNGTNSENFDKKLYLKIIRQSDKFNAFIHETLRCHGFVTFTLLRTINKSITIIDPKNKNIKYNLPKGTRIIGNIRSINNAIDNNNNNNNNEEWNFDYNKWLKNGKFCHISNFVTFGTGLRDCAGSALAKTQLYLVIATLILKFKFCIPQSYKNSDQDYIIPTMFTPFTSTVGVCVEKR